MSLEKENLTDVSNSSTELVSGILSYAAQPNVTSVGTLTGLLVGATSNKIDFPNAKTISSQDDVGNNTTDNIGLLGEAVADEENTGIGLLGHARVVNNSKATGIQGQAFVTSTMDIGAAVGIRGYSTDTHIGGYNIGILGNAMNSGIGNYAFYIQNGGVASIETETFWDLADNSVAALTFNSTGKANIFGIETTEGAEGIFTTGYLNVVGNISANGIKTNNYYYANGKPVDFQQAAGADTQLQFNDNNNFGSSKNLTFSTDNNTLTVNGNIETENLNATIVSSEYLLGTLTTQSQPNITHVGTLENLNVSGNILGTNLQLQGNVTASSFISNVTLGTAPLTVVSTTRVANLNVSYANVSDFSVITSESTGIYYPVFVSGSSNANYALSANSGLSANIANGGLIATTFVGNLFGNINGNIVNGTSTLSIPEINGNVIINAAGNANILVVTGTGVHVKESLNVIGNIVSENIRTNILNVNEGRLDTIVIDNNAIIKGNTIANNIKIISGEISSLNVLGNITANSNVNLNKHLIHSIESDISASGSTQETARLLTKDINVISIVNLGEGVILPTPIPGMRITIINTSSNILNVYPAIDTIINNIEINKSYTLPIEGKVDFIAISTTKWYTLG